MTNEKFTRANVTRVTDRIINRIAADEDKYVYQIIEEAIQKGHPEYFKNSAKLKEELKILNC